MVGCCVECERKREGKRWSVCTPFICAQAFYFYRIHVTLLPHAGLSPTCPARVIGRLLLLFVCAFHPRAVAWLNADWGHPISFSACCLMRSSSFVGRMLSSKFNWLSPKLKKRE